MTTATERAIDPVCGMTVNPERAAAKWDYKGQTYYFCNPSCLARFQAAPDSYLKSAEPAAATPLNWLDARQSSSGLRRDR